MRSAFKRLLAAMFLAGLSACTSRLPEAPALTNQSTEPVASTAFAAESKYQTQSWVDPMAEQKIPEELRAQYLQVNRLVADKVFDQATSLLHKLKNDYPNSAGISYRLAHLYWQRSDHAQALEQLEQTLLQMPENYFAYNLKGLILKSQGKFIAAKAAYQKALAIYPGYQAALLNLGILLDLYLQDLPGAREQYLSFQSLQNSENDQVKNWLIDLERRMASSESANVGGR